MLGGGTFLSHNKILPGAYINIVNASIASQQIGTRGTIALPIKISIKICCPSNRIFATPIKLSDENKLFISLFKNRLLQVIAPMIAK